MRRQVLFAGAAVALLVAASAAHALSPGQRVIVLGNPKAGVVALPGALDEFDWGAAATNVNGHAPTPGGPAWLLENAASGGTTKTLQLDGSGHLTMGANAAFNTEEYLTLPVASANILLATRNNLGGTCGTCTAMWGHASDFLKITGSGTSDALQWTYNSVARLNFRSGAGNGTETSKFQLNGVLAFAGDTLQRRYYNSGGWKGDFAINGDWFALGVDISAFGADYTVQNFGFLGNGGITSGTTNVALLDSYELTNLDTQSSLILRENYKVAPLATGGSLTQHLVGQYYGAQPAASALSLCYYDSTQTAISGKCPATISNVVIGAHAFSFDGPTFASGSLPGTNFYTKLCRTDTTPNMCSSGAAMSPGWQYAGTGQSLWINAIKNGAAGNPTTSLTNMFQWDGSSCKNSTCTESSGVTASKLLSKIPDQSAASAMAATFEANNGSKPFALVNCGQGGTNIVQRIPGATFVALPATNGAQMSIFDNCVDTLVNQAGKELRGLFIPDGEFDVSGTDFTNYPANQLLIIRGIKAAIGHDFNVCMRPVSSFQTTASSQDASWEQQRRQQAKFIADHASGDSTTPPVVHCGYAMEINHGDNYHPTGTGFGTMFQRMAFNELYAETGTASLQRMGGVQQSLSFTDATHIAVVYAVDSGVASAAVLNKTTTTDLAGGGNWWHNSSAFNRVSTGTTQTFDHIPTDASCAAPSGGLQTCTFTFSGGTWTTGDHAYLSGPWGAEPFNPRHDATHRNAESTTNSVLTFTYGDGTTATQQPFYDFAGGNDYLVSTNTCP